MENFSPLQNDLLTEAFNLGMGLAASALSQMVGEEIKLSVPKLLLIKRQQAAKILINKNITTVTGVKQHFDGPFNGDALLLFPVENSLALVKLLLKNTVPDDDLTELEEEALCEIGNIILNAGLASIANMFGQDIHSGLPNFIQGSSENIMHADNQDSLVFFMHVDFCIAAANINGYIIYMLDAQSIQDLGTILNKYLKKMSLSK